MAGRYIAAVPTLLLQAVELGQLEVPDLLVGIALARTPRDWVPQLAQVARVEELTGLVRFAAESRTSHLLRAQALSVVGPIGASVQAFLAQQLAMGTGGTSLLFRPKPVPVAVDALPVEDAD